MSDEKRRYRMTKRAELEAQTRRRITESAVALHGSIGPARTTISALAEHAGVQRATIYRHFPDEDAILAACSAHWQARNPPPDLAGWTAIPDPSERLAGALAELYGYYRRAEPMMANILRDEATVPRLTETLAGFRAFLRAAQDILLAGQPGSGGDQTLAHAALAHALAFPTWRSLALEQGLPDPEIVRLMIRFVAAAEGEPVLRPRSQT